MSELVSIGMAIREGGLTELVGINEQVDQNDFSGSVGVVLAPSPAVQSGEILSVGLYRTGGDFLDPAGKLIILDADPAVESGDTTLTAAEVQSILGVVTIADTDWVTVTAGAVAFKTVNIPFHALSNLYFVWLHTDATALNSSGGDDELLQVNFWYRRDS